MESLSAVVVNILSKYIIDAGVTLAQEVGQAAKDTAVSLLHKTLHHLRQKPESKAIADGYERNPLGYKAPLQDQLETAVQTDPTFQQELQQLVNQYEAYAQTFQANIQVHVGEGGVAAVGDGATAVGARGVSVDGSIHGHIITGDGNTIITGSGSGSVATLPPELAPLRDKLARYFDRSELETLCFDMGIAHDDLPGETRTQLAQSLVAYCYQRDRLPELRRRCQKERGHVDWS